MTPPLMRLQRALREANEAGEELQRQVEAREPRGFEPLLVQVATAAGRRPRVVVEASLGHLTGEQYMAVCSLLVPERNGIVAGHALAYERDIIWSETEREGVRWRWQADAAAVAAVTGAAALALAVAG